MSATNNKVTPEEQASEEQASEEKAVDEQASEEQPAEENEEEKTEAIQVVDQLLKAREECAEHASKFKEILDTCNARVRSKKKTAENCHEEMVEYVQHLDHCAMPKAFAELK